MTCTDCHHSVNNPIYRQLPEDATLEHLVFDARRMDIADYLYRPSHQLARRVDAEGRSDIEAAPLQCQSCHEPEATHEWLPYKERHFAAMSCETCHVPQMYAPARRTFDRTVVLPTGEPRVQCRGVADGAPGTTESLISGFEPVLLPRDVGDGNTTLAPYHLITAWYWVYGDPARPVRERDLQAAFLDNGQYHDDVVAALDGDGDGRVATGELALDTPGKVAVIAGRLAGLDLADPRIAGEIRPYAIDHGVTHGEWATKDCQTCHRQDSRLAQPFDLAAYVPGGVVPALVPDANTELTGNKRQTGAGALVYEPVTESEGLYVIGHNRSGWIGWAGALAALVVALGISTHGGLRVFTSLRQAHHEPQLRRVYMYTAYERTWHWLQALVITLLLFTGLFIHVPELFGALNFQLVVRVHNVLGFILVANAALAAFYHLATGNIRRYLWAWAAEAKQPLLENREVYSTPASYWTSWPTLASTW